MISIPRNDAFSNLSWTYARWLPGEPPCFTCPNGHKSVMANHIVEADGMVKGSVLCPEPGCGYHEHVKLEDWQPIQPTDESDQDFPNE